jgi:hypothetical protein
MAMAVGAERDARTVSRKPLGKVEAAKAGFKDRSEPVPAKSDSGSWQESKARAMPKQAVSVKGKRMREYYFNRGVNARGIIGAIYSRP